MRAIALTATIAAIGLTGCEKNTMCTDLLAWSVELSLVDEAGAPIEGATVSVTDGSITEDCESYEGTYTCGAELAGDLTISMEASGFAAEDLDVTVAADECHVISQQITHTMMAVDCTLDARPSVEVTVSDEDGAPIADAAVGYVSPNDEIGAESIDCFPLDGVFYCGEEVAGELEVFAEAAGFIAQSDVVTVGMTEDGCHVVTETLDFVLPAE